MRDPRRTLRSYAPLLGAILAVVVASFAGATVAVTIDDDGPGPQPARTIIQFPGGVAVSKAALDAARPDAASGLPDKGQRAETISPQTKREISSDAKAGTSGSDSPTPIVQGASFSERGCRTIPVRNYSGRGSLRPGLGVAHFTVSKNRPGWGDVLAVVSLFNNPRYQASSNYVIDAEGHCAYIVPESAKAWTQGNMNPFSACSVEQIGDQTDNGYRGAGLAKAAQVFGDCFHRWGIPRRLGRTGGRCAIERTGLVDHYELGCGNDHTDIRPWSPLTLVALVNRMGGRAGSILTRRERLIVSRTAFHARRGPAKWRRYWCRENRLQRARIQRAARARRGGWRIRHRGGRYQLLRRSARAHC